MVRVGIVGATGYTAFELLKILIHHPLAEVTSLTSRDEEAPHIDLVHPALRGQYDLQLGRFDIDQFVRRVDCAFCCLPHAASAEIVGQLVQRGVRVIDFSADYRFHSLATFENWYQVKHPDPTRLGSVPYGIPEFFRQEIKDAQVVANPGCFPSSALLPLVPLLEQRLIQIRPIIVDSKTGVSGAGRKPGLKFHFPECNESIAAYGVGTHRHGPEIDELIKRVTGTEADCIFTPHLVPMDRGILSTIYVEPAAGVTANELMNALANYYREEPFVRITEQLPATKDVAGTNFCDITVRQAGSMMILLSALDNLIKGASGAAIQNFNVMYGFKETTALGCRWKDDRNDV
jgi:N-acetyl-gamma-glutamyl-phosphate reductase